MTITWTKCSERMPPNDSTMVIARVGEDKETCFKVAGSLVTQEYNRWKNFGDVHVYWTPYTPEAWAESTNPDKVWLDELPEFLKKQAD